MGAMAVEVCARWRTPRACASTPALDPDAAWWRVILASAANRPADLLSNAVKFTGKGGYVWLAIERSGIRSRSGARHGHRHRPRVPARCVRAVQAGRGAPSARWAGSGSDSRSFDPSWKPARQRASLRRGRGKGALFVVRGTRRRSSGYAGGSQEPSCGHDATTRRSMACTCWWWTTNRTRGNCLRNLLEHRPCACPSVECPGRARSDPRDPSGCVGFGHRARGDRWQRADPAGTSSRWPMARPPPWR